MPTFFSNIFFHQIFKPHNAHFTPFPHSSRAENVTPLSAPQNVILGNYSMNVMNDATTTEWHDLANFSRWSKLNQSCLIIFINTINLSYS